MIRVCCLILAMGFICFSQVPEIATIDLSQLDPSIAEKIRELNENTKIEKKIIRYGKWVGMGKEVGIAVKDGLNALTEETNKFAETGVGKYVMFIIAFKILGYPIIQMSVGLLILIIGTIIFIVYFIRECLSNKYLKSERTENGVTTKEYGLTDNRMKALYSFLIYVALILICIAIMFIH